MTLLIWNNEKNPRHSSPATPCREHRLVPQKYATQLKVMKRPQPSSTSRSPSNLMENEFRLDARDCANTNIFVCCWKDLWCLTKSVIVAAFMKHNIKTNDVRETGFLQERAGKRMQMKLQPKFWVHLMLLSRQPSAFLLLVCREKKKIQSSFPLTTN